MPAWSFFLAVFFPLHHTFTPTGAAGDVFRASPEMELPEEKATIRENYDAFKETRISECYKFNQGYIWMPYYTRRDACGVGMYLFS